MTATPARRHPAPGGVPTAVAAQTVGSAGGTGGTGTEEQAGTRANTRRSRPAPSSRPRSRARRCTSSAGTCSTPTSASSRGPATSPSPRSSRTPSRSSAKTARTRGPSGARRTRRGWSAEREIYVGGSREAVGGRLLDHRQDGPNQSAGSKSPTTTASSTRARVFWDSPAAAVRCRAAGQVRRPRRHGRPLAHRAAIRDGEHRGGARRRRPDRAGVQPGPAGVRGHRRRPGGDQARRGRATTPPSASRSCARRTSARPPSSAGPRVSSRAPRSPPAPTTRATRSSRSGCRRARPTGSRPRRSRSRPAVRADEVCPTEPAVLAWAAQMGTITFHPWPVRRGDVDHPDELRHRPRPAARRRLPRRRRGGPRAARAARRARHDRLPARRPAAGASTSTCGWSRGGRSPTCGTRPSRSAASWSGGCRAGSPPPGGRSSGRPGRSSSTTTRTRGTAPSPAPTRCARDPARRCRRR